MPERAALINILELARWAPSGDNTQPWRFEIVSNDHIAVHGYDTRDWCLYDFDGHASHMAHGALLETLRVVATGFALEATWSIRPGCPDTAPIYDVRLSEAPGLSSDPLLYCVEKRAVQRRPMRITPLTKVQHQMLADAVGPGYRVQFLESLADRIKVARLLWDNAYVRLTCPEAYEVHKKIIEWGATYSKDRIPERAVGVDPLTAKLMKWVMVRWSRVNFFNRYLMGTFAPRFQLDALPALACSAHLVVRPVSPAHGLVEYVRAGVAMQRLWLTATLLGLYLQPQMTPVIFRWYLRANKKFSALQAIQHQLPSLVELMEDLAGASKDDQIVFFCRIGYSAAPSARSVRKDLEELMLEVDVGAHA